MIRKHLPESIKKRVAGKQNFKCANKPGSNLKNLEEYNCELWKFRDGSFGEASYEIDHIEEYSISQNHMESNLQALCPACHRVKTSRFRTQITEASHTTNKTECELTEVGFAKKLFELAGNSFIYVPMGDDSFELYCYNGNHWIRNSL